MGYERYEAVRDLGSGNFGVAKLMRDRNSGQLVAIKFIERGERVDRNVEREICNHRMLNHPNIVAFMEVFLTPSHLGIVMEFAAGGELFERIVRAGRFSEDEARYFFQQLISGVDYCHASGVCHRDLKLENTLLDGNPAPRLKICDFGYSKSAFDSQPKSTVGTPAYIAPEVLQRKEYNGQPADVWSCGVTLYVMLVGAYPFEDPADPRNFRKTIQRIMNVKFSFPPNLAISPECQDLISRIFVANPAARISIADIRRHPWFLKNLPAELADPNNFSRSPEPHQSLDDIRALIRSARTLGEAGGPKASSLPLEFNEDDYMDADELGGGGGRGGGMAGGGGMHSNSAGSGGIMSGSALGGGPGGGPGPGAGGGNGGGAYLLDNGYSTHGHMGSPEVGVGPGGHHQGMSLPMQLPMGGMQGMGGGLPPGHMAAAHHMHPGVGVGVGHILGVGGMQGGEYGGVASAGGYLTMPQQGGLALGQGLPHVAAPRGYPPVAAGQHPGQQQQQAGTPAGPYGAHPGQQHPLQQQARGLGVVYGSPAQHGQQHQQQMHPQQQHSHHHSQQLQQAPPQ